MNLLADENMPKKAFQAYRDLLQCMHEKVLSLTLVVETDMQSMPDDELVRSIVAMTPRPVILSADTGSTTRYADPRLPSLLPRYGISSIYLHGKLCQLSAFEKVRAVLAVHRKLLDVDKADPGSRFRILSDNSLAGYRLEEWPYDASREHRGRG